MLQHFGLYTTWGIPAADAAQATLGRKIDVIALYKGFAGPYTDFDADYARAAHASGRRLMTTLEPWDYSKLMPQPEFAPRNITAGVYDSYLTARADTVKSLGFNTWLRPMHEMNGNWYPWCAGVNGNTASEYIAAFRHIVNVFRLRGALNAKWVWCPNIVTPGGGPVDFRPFYPGARYVDVLALDGYNWGVDSTQSWMRWVSFADTFGFSYDLLCKLDPLKPVWVAETASAPDGGDKAQWVRDMFSVIPTRFPRMTTVVWFDTNKERDWRAEPVADAF